ncbi:hypothetical protein QL285_095244 [Trifolium repens]|nr:hypothetical protein QL285_095244 [Trifolium repens]
MQVQRLWSMNPESDMCWMWELKLLSGLVVGNGNGNGMAAQIQERQLRLTCLWSLLTHDTITATTSTHTQDHTLYTHPSSHTSFWIFAFFGPLLSHN